VAGKSYLAAFDVQGNKQIAPLTEGEQREVATYVYKYGMRRIADASGLDAQSVRRIVRGEYVRPNTVRVLRLWLAEVKVDGAHDEGAST
jgi:hypothetical protein